MNKFENSVRANPVLKRLFITADDQFIVGQSPNAPLYGALILFVLSLVVKGQMQISFIIGYRLCLIIWSIAEIGWGVNLFRRILGAGILILEIGGLFQI